MNLTYKRPDTHTALLAEIARLKKIIAAQKSVLLRVNEGK